MSNGFTLHAVRSTDLALPTVPRKRRASIIKLIARGGLMLSVKAGSMQEPIRASQAAGQLG